QTELSCRLSLLSSSGSVAVIVCMFLLVVVLVLGGLYHYKRTSYGPLMESFDHGSIGNFPNPMYDP
uniref:Uncharacterized protein n=1 Tax=Cyprinodon variegatus TaxID=28743 RepID=A0A3Q2CZW0_CYPVA